MSRLVPSFSLPFVRSFDVAVPFSPFPIVFSTLFILLSPTPLCLYSSTRLVAPQSKDRSIPSLAKLARWISLSRAQVQRGAGLCTSENLFRGLEYPIVNDRRSLVTRLIVDAVNRGELGSKESRANGTCTAG